MQNNKNRPILIEDIVRTILTYWNKRHQSIITVDIAASTSNSRMKSKER